MPFEIPESYRAYCTDVAVRTAVDHILSSSDRRSGLALPADIDWKDLPAFHRALLSAHQVRCEYPVLLIRLWNAVWQPALDECDFGRNLEPWTVSAAQEWYGQTLDTNTVWNQGWFARGFDIVGTNFRLAPGISDDARRVTLYFSFWGQDDTDYTTDTHFGDDWPEQQKEGGWALTTKGLAAIRDDGTIDVDPLRRAAADALAAAAKAVISA